MANARQPVVKLDAAQIKQLMRGRNGPVWRDIQLRTNRVLNKARTLTPVDTGRLRQSLTSEMRDESYGPTGRVGTNIEYGLYIHEGTGINGPRHRYIVPVNAKILRWPRINNSGKGNRRYKAGSTSQYVFARRSSGVKGRPFLAQALSAAQGTRKVEG